MLSSGQTSIVDIGQSIQLDCEFHALSFDLFHNPTVWIKDQFNETTRINMMGNLYEPFISAHRFKSTFYRRPPRYYFGLFIEGLSSSLYRFYKLLFVLGVQCQCCLPCTTCSHVFYTLLIFPCTTCIHILLYLVCTMYSHVFENFKLLVITWDFETSKQILVAQIISMQRIFYTT